MNHFVIKTDFNHPVVRAKIKAASELLEINEFSTVDQMVQIASLKIKAELERQLGICSLIANKI